MGFLLVKTVTDLRRLSNFMFLDENVVDLGSSYFPDGVNLHIPKIIPKVDKKYKWAKFLILDVPVFYFFKNKVMFNDEIEILM